MIKLTSLGHCSIRRDGAELRALSALKQKCALLLYLAIEGPASRDHLLALFWPEREEGKARHSLSQALYHLRRELTQDCLEVRGDLVTLNTAAFTVDAKQLEEAAAAEDWERVVDLYRGAFLDQFYLTESPGFEAWQSRVRMRLARLARQAFRRVLDAREAAGDTSEALTVATRWAALEPLEDEAQHVMITLLARSGDRTAALEHFEAYRARLALELEVEPLQETIDLVEAIRAGGVLELRPLAARVDRPEVDAPPPTPAPAGDGGPTAALSRGAWRLMLKELRTRRVFQVALIYLGVAWLAIQMVDILIERGMLPESTFQVLIFFLILGLPIAVILAWAQEQGRVEPGAPALGDEQFWPAWAKRVRPGHVLAVLGTLMIGLLVAVNWLQRPPPTTQPPIEKASFDPTKIAVLYLEDHSEAAANAHIAAAFTHALIRELGQVENLTVRPASAVKPFRAGDVMLDSIVHALQIGTLVDGSILGVGDVLRVNVELVDAFTLSQLSSVELEGRRSNPLALLDSLATRVSEELRTQLGIEIRLREQKAGTESVIAWERVQQAAQLVDDAEQLWSVGDTVGASTGLQRADSLLLVAENLDPNWIEPTLARGWVAATRATYFGVDYGSYEETEVRMGIAHAEHALDMEANLPEALELRGVLKAYLWESADPASADSLLRSAEQDLRAAIAADPMRATALSGLSQVLHRTGRFDEAKLFAGRAYEADAYLSEGDTPLFRLCYIHWELEELEEARRWCAELNRRFPRHATPIEIELSLLSSSFGGEPDPDRAWSLMRAWEDAEPPQRRAVLRPVGLLYVAAVLARAGLVDSTAALIERAHAADARGDPDIDYYEANVRVQLGEEDEAIELLGDYLAAEPEERGYIARDWFWTSLRDHPDFRALVQATSD